MVECLNSTETEIYAHLRPINNNNNNIFFMYDSVTTDKDTSPGIGCCEL